jgi:NADH:ubiquinone oxidoreductase subunit 6 (subunit J)
VWDLHLGLPQGLPVLGGPRLNLDLTTWVFLLVGAATFVSGAVALLSREIVHTVIFIGGLFAGLAVVYFLLQAPFIGLLQLSVYAGAVTILLMFAVMVVKRRIFARESVLGVQLPTLILSILVGAVIVNVALESPSNPPVAQPYSVSQLSSNLFLANGAWVLLLGFVMLSALAGAVHLAREWRTPAVRRVRED